VLGIKSDFDGNKNYSGNILIDYYVHQLAFEVILSKVLDITYFDDILVPK